MNCYENLAESYSRFRPIYPKELFEYLSSLCTLHDCAVDFGTGNGQAACALVKSFGHVIAVDKSSKQLSLAPYHKRVSYINCAAEDASLLPNSVNLITVAQALHWFDIEEFYKVSKRALKADGIFAAWTYKKLFIDPDIDTIIEFYYSNVLGSYWPQKIYLVNENYKTIYFPFRELRSPSFVMKMRWSFDHLIGYLSSSSAVHFFTMENKYSPVAEILKDIKEAWGDISTTREIHIPIYIRIGENNILNN